jgi:hypothetical protein
MQGGTAEEPFAERRAVNAAVFLEADPAAATRLRTAGVDYLFVDRWAPAAALDSIGRLVFENDAARIYQLAGQP